MGHMVSSKRLEGWLVIILRIIGNNIFSLCIIMIPNKDKIEYANFGKVGFNNHVSLSHNNILQRAHQWEHFYMRKNSGATLPDTFISYV